MNIKDRIVQIIEQRVDSSDIDGTPEGMAEEILSAIEQAAISEGEQPQFPEMSIHQIAFFDYLMVEVDGRQTDERFKGRASLDDAVAWLRGETDNDTIRQIAELDTDMSETAFVDSIILLQEIYGGDTLIQSILDSANQ